MNEPGDTVWFNRGSGSERGTVIFSDNGFVAIGIGDRSALDGESGFIERIIRPRDELRAEADGTPQDAEEACARAEIEAERRLDEARERYFDENGYY